MKFLLNIGLARKASPDIAAHVALEIVKANDFLIGKHKVVQSDTEATLVVEATFPGRSALLCIQMLRQISIDLEQDCIAVYRPETNGGSLVGPKAKEWGEFNPEFFFLLNGKRLAPQKAAA